MKKFDGTRFLENVGHLVFGALFVSMGLTSVTIAVSAVLNLI